MTVTKWMLGIDPPPFWKRNLQDRFPDYDGPVDRWQIIQLHRAVDDRASTSGVAKAGTGAPEGDRSQGVTGYVINTMTPETDNTCFYLWAFARDWCLDKQVITTRLREGVSRRLLRGRGDAGGPAARHRGQPRLRLLQPQHRRRQHVDPAHRAAHDRSRAGSDTGRDDEHSGTPPRPRAPSAAASQRRPAPSNGSGQGAEVAGGVARHRDAPAAGLMARGL